jgi:hypothetical protein
LSFWCVAESFPSTMVFIGCVRRTVSCVSYPPGIYDQQERTSRLGHSGVPTAA